MNNNFIELMAASTELAQDFPDGLIYIGGIAVYLHAINQRSTKDLAETTHDADLYISLADFADLRELEEVSTNKRLSKHELKKRGFSFDIYTERHASLRVPYDAVSAYSVTYGQVKVACLEHLLVLKVGAYVDRKGSAKGEKDARDILRIVAVAEATGNSLRTNLILPYWGEEEVEELQLIAKGSGPTALANGNAHEAKRFRQALQDTNDALKKALLLLDAAQRTKPRL
ncbi:hypothetical protein [Xanthomonas arboricola]|uniref:hypothetical protein n=1 Tax=Xanthomonas arboricola TaxID=56448 RepID=UPI0011AFE623|nr:hypothetical protein [Xanthomonas arboricola]